ncbi:uncharacterized protein LOC129582289 isoform X2 [Paramacrobiotus metropolitanus]|uniref:uncharacterized protein LOC129582289 isoform X2 n=1 Tax=Paramacrobiotus metropolitanus TaxID=2943436 RepID=UPI002445DBF4|nr:uncharacterized protein LOC129582289 isoform X2 [Paramacrobiotus metropolitanus]
MRRMHKRFAMLCVFVAVRLVRGDLIEIFRDDFNDDVLNDALWIKPPPIEIQGNLYEPDNLHLRNGQLVLGTGSRHNGSAFRLTGTRISTGSKFNFTYGEMTLRAKLPVPSNHLATSMILLHPCKDTPQHNCTDDELVPIPGLEGISVATHFLTSRTIHKDAAGNRNLTSDHVHIDADLSADYHLFKLVWTREFLGWFVDDQLVINATVPGLSTWPRLFIVVGLMNEILYSAPENFPYQENAAPYQELLIDYISVLQFSNTTRSNTGIASGMVLSSIVPVIFVVLALALLWILVKRKRAKHGNMKKTASVANVLQMASSVLSSLSAYSPFHAQTSTFQAESAQCVQCLEIPLARVQLVHGTLSESASCIVQKGFVEGLYGECSLTAAAVKRSAAPSSQLRQLREEAEIMAAIGQHMNIIALLGVILKGKPLLLYEWAEFGTLSNYLKTHRDVWFYNHIDLTGELLPFNQEIADERQSAALRTPPEFGLNGHDRLLLSTRILLRFAQHIAQGLEYLHTRSIIHRDLSADNVLICGGQVAKIGGFGMAKRATEYIALNTQNRLRKSDFHRIRMCGQWAWSCGNYSAWAALRTPMLKWICLMNLLCGRC